MPLSRRRQNLKALTAGLHRQLDDKVGTLDNREQYTAYVNGMLRFRRRVEGRVSASNLLRDIPGFSPIMIADELESDVKNLGGNLAGRHEAAEESALTRDELLGTLYVLEGSALGARILIRRAAGLGLDENNGAAHLEKQFSNAGNWNAFAALLETVRNVDEDAIGKAALATFAAAISAFEIN